MSDIATDDRERCDECGAIVINDPEQSPQRRLEALGYLAEDTYHPFEDGQTYHGHGIEGTDSFTETQQNHDSDDAHEIARHTFEESRVRCPRHYRSLQFCKSVAPSGDEHRELHAQGKCPTCEYVGLVVVRE